MNLYPTTKIIFDRRKVSGAGKEGSVELEIYHDRKRKWISTGVKVLPRNWNDRKRVVGRIDSVDLNLRIENVENIVVSFIRKLMIAKKPFTWSEFESEMTNKREEDSFIRFVASRVENRKDISEGTRKNHKKFYKALLEFNKVRNFSDITKPNIVLYDEWLRGRKTYTQATIATYHKFMKVYVNEAIRKELIQFNPYDGMKIDRGKSKLRKSLTPEELEDIENVELPTLSLKKARDLFLFQCYTGLAYADLSKFDFNTVMERNGKHVVHDVRQKTGEEFYIVLLPKAIHILKRYDYRLPLISNQQYNMRLKIVADAAALDKQLTSHMGRHTYATICLNSGIKIEVLAKMMGHSDIKTTQVFYTLNAIE